MMVDVKKVYDAFIAQGVDFFTGVPDSLLQSICAYITDFTPKEKNLIAANEGAAVGVAAGYYLATGKIPLVYMQNSGLGNAINPLLSLVDEKVYKLPMLFMVGWRGEPGIKDEPQHKKQGEVTIALLEAMQIPYTILDEREEMALQQIQNAIVQVKNESISHVLLIRKGLFGKYKLQKEVENDYPLSREEALKITVAHLKERDIVVSTTGKLSRELYEYRTALGQGHARDFLTVGSMGHASSIALGIAIEKTDREVFCFDGDGAFIMHMGAISNIGELAPMNYRHFVFNNGAHESVGGQPTAAFYLDIPAVAKACGYKHVFVAKTKDELERILMNIREVKGPVLLEIRVRIDSRGDLGRPATSPVENKHDFMNFLKNG